jgi:hypothetical protein
VFGYLFISSISHIFFPLFLFSFTKPTLDAFTGGAFLGFITSLAGSACLLDRYRNSQNYSELELFERLHPFSMFGLIVPATTGTFLSLFSRNDLMTGFALAINAYVAIFAIRTAVVAADTGDVFSPVGDSVHDTIVAGCALQFVGSAISSASTFFAKSSDKSSDTKTVA